MLRLVICLFFAGMTACAASAKAEAPLDGSEPAAEAAAETPSEPVSFVRQVAPILVAKCQACHGSKTFESNYRVDGFDRLMHPGDYGTPPVTAGDLNDSEVYRLITAEDPAERMPNNGDRLADAEIATIAAWIRQGAAFDGQDPASPLEEQIPRDLAHPAAPDSYPTAMPVTALAFTADGASLVIGGYHELLVYEVATGRLSARVGNIPQRTFGLAFSPDHAWLAVAGGTPGVSGEVRLLPWAGVGVKPDAPPVVLARHDDAFFDAAFRPDGQRLAAAGSDGSVRVFDMTNHAELRKIEAHADWVSDLCFSADGARLATGSRDKTAKVFDPETGALLAGYAEHEGPVRAVAFDVEGKHVLSAGGGKILVWTIDASTVVGELAGFDREVTALAAAGESALAASAGGSVRQFKLADREVIRDIPEAPRQLLSLAWHEPTHHAAVGSLDGTVAIWNLESGAPIARFTAQPGAPAAAK